MTRTKVSRFGLVAAGALVSAIVAGCGESSGGSAAPPTTDGSLTTTQAPTTTSSSGPSTTQPTTSGERTDTDPRMCKAGELKLSIGTGDAAAGTVYRPLQFTNTGDRSCVLQGFPGVSYVAGDDGHQVGPAAHRDGEKGAPVTLAKGDMAHAPVGFVQVRNYTVEDCKPVPVRGLRVYPPQEYDSLFVSYDGEGCSSDQIPGNQLVVKTIQPGSGEPT